VSRFRLTEKAYQDVREIAEYTQDMWGSAQRRKYLDDLNGKFQLLADMPLMAAERKEIDPPIRIFRYESHLIVYLVEDGGILILRIRHHSEDWLDDPP